MIIKTLSFLTTLILLMIVPQISSSQTMNKLPTYKIGNNPTDEQKWSPINKFEDYQNVMQSSPDDPGTPVLTNILNGVSFYSMISNCDSEKILLVKLINSNDYPVSVSWKMSSSTPDVVVLIPASSSQVGSCSNADLIIKNPINTDREEAFKYALTHLNVIKIEE